MSGKPIPLEIRFWKKVVKTDGCWLWTGAKCGMKRDRGHILLWHRDGKSKYEMAYRVAWMLTNGPIPEGMDACHKCDNGLCVRPDHLFLGTAVENEMDSIQKGRYVVRRNHGKRSPKRLLSDIEVAEMRATYDASSGRGRVAALARKFNVSRSTASRIVRRTYRNN